MEKNTLLDIVEIFSTFGTNVVILSNDKEIYKGKYYKIPSGLDERIVHKIEFNYENNELIISINKVV